MLSTRRGVPTSVLPDDQLESRAQSARVEPRWQVEEEMCMRERDFSTALAKLTVRLTLAVTTSNTTLWYTSSVHTLPSVVSTPWRFRGRLQQRCKRLFLCVVGGGARGVRIERVSMRRVHIKSCELSSRSHTRPYSSRRR